MSQESIIGNATVRVDLANGQIIYYPATTIGAVGSSIESKWLDLGNPTREKYVDHIVLDFNAAMLIPLFYLSVGFVDSLEDEANANWINDIQVVNFNPIIEIRETAKFWKLKFRDELPITQWALSRIEFYGRVMGGRLIGFPR